MVGRQQLEVDVRLVLRPVVHPIGTASSGEDAMGFNAIKSPAHAATVLLVAGLLSLGWVISPQTGEQSSGVNHTPVTSAQEFSDEID
jgi:hypothetical protein